MGVNKTCNVCKENKSIGNFYKQKAGLYGRTGECKSCRKLRSIKWAKENKEKKREYEKKRSLLVDRKEEHKIWREKNPNYFKEYYNQNKDIRLKCNKRYLENNPNRSKTYAIYRKAIRDKLIIKSDQCQICGMSNIKIHGHHFDYSKPLQVTWLCIKCHKDVHRNKVFK